MKHLIAATIALAGACALAGCASTTGSIVTLASVGPGYSDIAAPITNQPATPAYRVFPSDDENGNPEQGDSLH